MNNNINNLRFVYFTNENNIPLIKLSLKYFFKYNTLDNIKISVISNNYKNYDDLPFKDKVEYLKGNVEFSHDGGHFSKSLKNTLPNIKEDYIFFFCDDYFFISETKFDDLDKLMSFIIEEDVDYFGFDDISGNEIYSFKPYEKDNFPFSKESLYHRDNNYKYLYSVQPSIWKKSSLLELANNFEFSLHGLDETLPHIKQNNMLKCFSNNLSSHFSFKDLTDYFIIAYLEIIRHGVLFHPANNSSLNSNYLSVKFIDKLVYEEDLRNKSEYKKIMFYL
jgi:hypothetical protein